MNSVDKNLNSIKKWNFFYRKHSYTCCLDPTIYLLMLNLDFPSIYTSNHPSFHHISFLKMYFKASCRHQCTFLNTLIHTTS